MKNKFFILIFLLIFSSLLGENFYLLQKISNFNGILWDAKFSHDGKFLTVVGENELYIYKENKGTYEKIFSEKNKDCAFCISFSDDDEIMAVGYWYSKTVKIFRKKDNSYYLSNTLFTNGSINSLAFDSQAKYLIGGSLDNSIKVWEIEDNQFTLNQEILGYSNANGNLKFLEGTKYISSGNLTSPNLNLKIWEKENTIYKSYKNLLTYANLEAFLVEGNYVAVREFDNKISLMEKSMDSIGAVVFNKIQTLDKKNYLKSIFSKDEKKIVLIDDEGKADFFVKKDYLFQKEKTFDDAYLCDIQEDGNILLTLNFNGEIKIYSLSDPEEMIKNYINQSFIDWNVKGEYESENQYNNRIKNFSLKEKNEEFASQALNFFKQKIKDNYEWKISIVGNYNSEDETYILNFPIIEKIQLKVPLYEAKSFKENIKDLKIYSQKIVIDKNTWILESAYIFNPQNGKKYLVRNDVNKYIEEEINISSSSDVVIESKQVDQEELIKEDNNPSNEELPKSNDESFLNSI